MACYYLFSLNLDFYTYSFSSYILKFIFIDFILLICRTFSTVNYDRRKQRSVVKVTRTLI